MFEMSLSVAATKKGARKGMMVMEWGAFLGVCLSSLVACRPTVASGTPGSPVVVRGAAASGEPEPPAAYGVRGLAGGVREPVALELRFPSGSERLDITTDGPFAFKTQLARGTSYTVSFVDKMPPCLLDGSSGVLADTDPVLGLACNGAATLSDIGLSGLTAPDLGFMPGLLAYTVEVSLLQQSVSVTPIALDPDATVTVSGQPVATRTASAPLPLDLGENQIDVVVSHASGLQRTYRLTVRRAMSLAQYAYGKASNTGLVDNFCTRVALSGDTLAVSAPEEDSAAKGVNGNQSDDSAERSGAVYVFRRTGTAWTQEAYLKASNTGADDGFGRSVALSGDTLAVGAPREDSAAKGVDGNQDDDSAAGSGAVYVFRRTGTAWTQEAYLKASNASGGDHFGISVALSDDSLAVGAPGEASAVTGVNGSPDKRSGLANGAVYVFRRADAAWAQQAYIKASNTGMADEFGISVALSGDTLAVGAHHEDSAATGVDGSQSDNRARDSGAVYVFRRAGETWLQEAYLKASNTGAGDEFGVSVAVSGDLLAVGVPNEASAAKGVNGNQSDDSAERSGAVYVFRRTGTAWTQEAYFKASNTNAGDRFGVTVALSGDLLAVGAPEEGSGATGVNGNQDDDSVAASGAVYVFRHSGAAWAQEAYLKASNTGWAARFGSSVVLSGDTLAAGALEEGSGATGVGGNQSDNGANQSGAVYVFH